MVEKELVMVSAVSDILDIRRENPRRLDEELMRIFIETHKDRLKNKRDRLDYLYFADLTLKLKRKNPQLARKEIIQIILEGAKQS
jgi:hypothetical protein